jgi:hypothetical protein
MKVYNRYYKNRFSYPKDMELILDYLKKHGEILVNESTIESLYYDFSGDVYDAGWMSVDDELLKEFEEWLNNYEYEFE